MPTASDMLATYIPKFIGTYDNVPSDASTGDLYATSSGDLYMWSDGGPIAMDMVNTDLTPSKPVCMVCGGELGEYDICKVCGSMNCHHEEEFIPF